MKNQSTRPLSSDEPIRITSSETTRNWHKAALQACLYIFLSLGMISTALALQPSFINSNKVFLYASISFTLLSLILLVFRKLPHPVRVSLGIISYFIFSNVLFLEYGWRGLSLTALLGFSFVCSSLLTKKIAIFGYGITLLNLVFWSNFAYADLASLTFTSFIFEIILVVICGLIGNLLLIMLHDRLYETSVQSSKIRGRSSDGKENEPINKKDTEIFTQNSFEICQTLNSVQEPQFALKKAVDLVIEHFNLYFSGIYLLDQAQEYAVLIYGSGDPGKRMLTSSYRLALAGTSLVSKAIREKQTESTIDNEPSNDFRALENPFLPESTGEMVIPFIKAGEVIGALDIHFSAESQIDENIRTRFAEIAELFSLLLSNINTLQPLRSRSIKTHTSAPTNEPGITELTYENPSLFGASEKKSHMEYPIVVDNQKVGSFDLEVLGNGLSPDQLNFIKAISDQTVSALRNTSKFEYSVRQTERDKKLLEITSKIHSTTDSQKMLQIVLEEISQTLGVKKAQIVLNVPEMPRDEEYQSSETLSFSRKRTTGELHEP